MFFARKIHSTSKFAMTVLSKSVCVDHLYRCKTSLRYLSVFVMVHDFLFMQGGSARLTDTAQRRHCQFMVIQSLISSAYLHQFFISLNGNRLSQVPACRFVSFSSLWTKLHQNLPQSKDAENIPGTLCPTVFKPLYGFRNLIYCRLRQMEQLHLART